MNLRKGFTVKLLPFTLLFIFYVSSNAFGALNFAVEPSGAGSINITSCTGGTCSPTPPVVCPSNCSLTCSDGDICQAHYSANANPGYVFLGFDICGQQISPEQNPWVSGWQEQGEYCSIITARFQQVQGTAVPTMTEWGMIIFMALAGLMSIYFIRRRKRTEY